MSGGGVLFDKSNPMGYMVLMQTVCQTSLFIRQAEKLFSADDLAAMVSFLAANPQSGDIIPGTGGVRKVRVPVRGRGKRGGARVIYYWFDARAPLYALLVYAKNTRLDMTADERKEVCALAAAIKAAYRIT